jgi:hypothetical protein
MIMKTPENAHVKTAENRAGNDSKNLSPLGQNLLQLAKITAAAAMDNAKAELGLIGQIVTSLSYTKRHQNISV